MRRRRVSCGDIPEGDAQTGISRGDILFMAAMGVAYLSAMIGIGLPFVIH